MAVGWIANTPNLGTGVPFDSIQHIPLPSPVNPDILEQWQIARFAAMRLRASRALGEGVLYDVQLLGGSAGGHPNGDNISVTVTNRNGPAGSPTAWSCPTNGSTITFGKAAHVPPPTVAPREVQEQYMVARQVAEYMRGAKVIGEGSNYQVNLSGNASPGHTNGDSITIAITNKN